MKRLSKTRYTHGLQFHKYLWLETWRKELKNEVDKATDEIFVRGTRWVSRRLKVHFGLL